MKQCAIIVAPGCEEGETLTITDIIRRANFNASLVGLGSNIIEGGHGIIIQCDEVFTKSIQDYDMIILPGGYGGVDAMLDSELLLQTIDQMTQEKKWIAAMCAAPIVLEKAGVLKGKNYTAYRGYDEKIHQGNYVDQTIVVDDNMITAQGPALCYAFGYQLVDALGGDSLAVKNRMVYFNAFDVKEA